MKLTQNQIKSKYVVCGGGKAGVPGEKPFGAEKRTNKLNPHMTLKYRVVGGKCS